MKHRVGIAGEGPPLLLIQGLGYGRWGWEPILAGLAASHRVVCFDNRGIGESDKPAGPYTAAQMAGDALQVLDEAGIDRAHVLGASLGGMIAQELAVAAPERVERLVLACTTRGGPTTVPMPEVTVRLFAEAPSLAPEVALRRFVENALGEDPPVALVDELFALRVANPPDPAGWQAQAAAGMGFEGVDAEIAAPTLILGGTADNVVDYRNAEVLAARIPGCSRRAARRRGHLFFWEEPDECVRIITEFLHEPAHHRQDHPRPRPDHARPDRDRRARAHLDATPSSTRDLTSWRVASRTGIASRRSPATPASTLRSCSRARRRVRSCTRSRGGSPRPRSPSSSTTPSPPLFLIEDEYRELGEAALELAQVQPALAVETGSRSDPGTGAFDEDPLLLIYTSGTTGKPKGALLTHANCFWTSLSFDLATGIRPEDVVLQVLPQFHCGGLERAVDPCVVEGRTSSCSSAASTRRGRSSESNASESPR